MFSLSFTQKKMFTLAHEKKQQCLLKTCSMLMFKCVFLTQSKKHLSSEKMDDQKKSPSLSLRASL